MSQQNYVKTTTISNTALVFSSDTADLNKFGKELAKFLYEEVNHKVFESCRDEMIRLETQP